MQPTLNPAQLTILRRCSGGLRVWETGPALAVLLAELDTLRQLRLVNYEEGRGFETSAAGEAWLIEFDE